MAVATPYGVAVSYANKKRVFLTVYHVYRKGSQKFWKDGKGVVKKFGELCSNIFTGLLRIIYFNFIVVEELNDSIKGRRAPWDADYGWMDFRKRLFQDKDNEEY